MSGYDRAALTPSVVHIGVGCFHRAHQAVYFDELARRGATGWGLVGVGLHSPAIGRVLAAQDNRYTVVVRGPSGDQVRAVDVLGRYLFAPDDPSAVLEALADERTQLVTLTITAAAYRGGHVDPADPDVCADVERPHAPGTAFGYLVEALDRRRRAGREPFTVLSCDNLDGNGPVTRRAVLATARLRDPALAAWIGERVSFPSSTVDRITPDTSPQERAALARAHGLDDAWPVVTEPFSQWVVEDDFCAARPPLEQVGVQFVRDVRPYALRKTRLLNGAHRALGSLGGLAGHSTAAGAMADPVLRRFVEGYLEEASAVLPPLPGSDLAAYRSAVLDRLSNPRLSDPLSRLRRQGSVKMPGYVLASLHEALAQDLPHEHLLLVVAAWMRTLRGTDRAGRAMVLDDVAAERLQPLAAAGGTDPRPLLSDRSCFGDLGDDPAVVAALQRALEALEQDPLGAAAAVVLRHRTTGSSSRPAAHAYHAASASRAATPRA